eukprot:CAMPEP_0184124670 /NCGR_PEP_ID=MMETSP0974-20121125/24635_1 /TAXON_ID=483370 /ORGANISM="non described non described, Strain CCMP2097" /LENGTH=230 /DNA_ID=CAMNT_0026427971 /DNA_START=30 /DNA_END=718 /DNA_ORIENTATION=+
MPHRAECLEQDEECAAEERHREDELVDDVGVHFVEPHGTRHPAGGDDGAAEELVDGADRFVRLEDAKVRVQAEQADDLEDEVADEGVDADEGVPRGEVGLVEELLVGVDDVPAEHGERDAARHDVPVQLRVLVAAALLDNRRRRAKADKRGHHRERVVGEPSPGRRPGGVESRGDAPDREAQQQRLRLGKGHPRRRFLAHADRRLRAARKLGDQLHTLLLILQREEPARG